MHADLAARRSRVAAAWIVALIVTVVAASAHTLAGGAPPHLTALVVAGLVSGFLGMAALSALRSGALSRLGLAGLVALDQLVQHAAFTLLAPTGGGAAAASADAVAGHAGHAAHAAPSVAIAATGIPLDAAAPALMGAHHALAAAVSFVLLRRGAAAIAAALEALELALTRLVEPVAATAFPSPARAPLGAVEHPLAPAVVVLGGSGRRGPPVLGLARVAR